MDTILKCNGLIKKKKIGNVKVKYTIGIQYVY